MILLLVLTIVYHTVFFAAVNFRLAFSRCINNLKLKVGAANWNVKNLLTNTCQSQVQAYMYF